MKKCVDTFVKTKLLIKPKFHIQSDSKLNSDESKMFLAFPSEMPSQYAAVGIDE